MLHPQEKEQLAQDNLALVEEIIRLKFRNFLSMRDWDDMFSDGLWGLAIAVNKYYTNRGIKFKTYAQKWIEGKIIDGFREEHAKNLDGPKKQFLEGFIYLEDFMLDRSASHSLWDMNYLDRDLLIDFKTYFPKALEVLTDLELEVYHLVEILGYAMIEVARLKKCGISNISQIVTRTKKKLKDYLLCHNFWGN